MSTSKRSLVSLASVVGALVAMLAFAVSASAVPAGYAGAPTISVSTQAASEGGSLVVTCANFASGEQVDITLQTFDLGSATADASGSVTKTVTLPQGVAGAQTIVCTGLTSGKTASLTITISAASSGEGTGTGAGGLPNTGVAVIGIGTLGVALLLGGGLLLLAGKRRKVRA